MDPLGYDSNEEHMATPTKLAPQMKARFIYTAAMNYFNGLEGTVKEQFGGLLNRDSIDLRALTDAEITCKKKQSDLSRTLFAECKKFEIPTARIGGKLFGSGEGSYHSSLVESYTDLVALDRARKAVRIAGDRSDREDVLRGLTSYVEQYNGREPSRKLAFGVGSQTYAEHFGNAELSFVVLNLLDTERMTKRPVELPLNGNPAWRKLGFAVADKYRVLFDAANKESQEKLQLLRKGADATVTSRTTSMFQIPKIEGL